MKKIMRIFVMSLLLSVTITTGWCSTSSTSDSGSDEEGGFVPTRLPKRSFQLPIPPVDGVLRAKDGLIEMPYYTIRIPSEPVKPADKTPVIPGKVEQ